MSGDPDELRHQGIAPLQGGDVVQHGDADAGVEQVAAEGQQHRVAAEGLVSLLVPGHLAPRPRAVRGTPQTIEGADLPPAGGGSDRSRWR